MKELSLHILDLVENSIKAKARLISIKISENISEDLFVIEIEDNGSGMDEKFLKSVEDPFVTTRTTRKVGLGISLIKAAALRCDGNFKISSQKKIGTKVYCGFKHSHIDRAPLGNMGETMVAIINQCEESEIVFEHRWNNKNFIMDTKEVKKILDGVNINSAEILLWIKDYINSNIKELKGS